MNKKEFAFYIICLCSDYDANKSFIISLLERYELDWEFLNWLLIDLKKGSSRSYRFRLFIQLVNTNIYLRKNKQLCFRYFKQSYILTDNIYSKIQIEDPRFDLCDFLLSLGDQNFYINLMDEEERNFFNMLEDELIIYRGMCDAEKQSGVWGISWTCNYDYACKYPFYPPNEVTDDVGWIAKTRIKKSEILTIIGEQRKLKEIVIRPRIIDEFIPFPRVKEN